MTAISNVNLADVSQFLVGSDTLKLTPFFIKNFTIPSVAFAHPSLMNRSGVALHLGADAVDFNDLSLDITLDSNFKTYFELLDLTFKEVDWNSDTFAMPTFNLWVQVLNQNKELLFRVDFVNCRVASLGEIALDPNAELGATVNVSLVYDYWTYTKSGCVENFTNGDGAGNFTNGENRQNPGTVDLSKCTRGPQRWFEKPLQAVKKP